MLELGLWRVTEAAEFAGLAPWTLTPSAPRLLPRQRYTDPGGEANKIVGNNSSLF